MNYLGLAMTREVVLVTENHRELRCYLNEAVVSGLEKCKRPAQVRALGPAITAELAATPYHYCTVEFRDVDGDEVTIATQQFYGHVTTNLTVPSNMEH